MYVSPLSNINLKLLHPRPPTIFSGTSPTSCHTPLYDLSPFSTSAHYHHCFISTDLIYSSCDLICHDKLHYLSLHITSILNLFLRSTAVYTFFKLFTNIVFTDSTAVNTTISIFEHY